MLLVVVEEKQNTNNTDSSEETDPVDNSIGERGGKEFGGMTHWAAEYRRISGKESIRGVVVPTPNEKKYR